MPLDVFETSLTWKQSVRRTVFQHIVNRQKSPWEERFVNAGDIEQTQTINFVNTVNKIIEAEEIFYELLWNEFCSNSKSFLLNWRLWYKTKVLCFDLEIIQRCRIAFV